MQYVALLRGVNVGGRTITMTALRACFEVMGFRDVSTVLQSGNVIFRSDDDVTTLTSTIESGLRDTFAYPAHAQVVAWDRLGDIVGAQPFDASNPERHAYVVFFKDGLENQLVAEASALDSEVDQIVAGDGVIYWSVPKGLTLKTGFARFLTLRPYRDAHTNRNISTLKKILR